MAGLEEQGGAVTSLSPTEEKVLLAAYRTKDYKWNRVTYQATGINHADLVWETGLTGAVVMETMERLAARGLLEFLRTTRGRIIPDNMKLTESGAAEAERLDASGTVELLGPRLPATFNDPTR